MPAKESVAISQEAANEIAKRARGTPRIALRLLRRVRDFAQVKGSGTIDRSVLVTRSTKSSNICKHTSLLAKTTVIKRK